VPSPRFRTAHAAKWSRCSICPERWPASSASAQEALTPWQHLRSTGATSRFILDDHTGRLLLQRRAEDARAGGDRLHALFRDHLLGHGPAPLRHRWRDLAAAQRAPAQRAGWLSAGVVALPFVWTTRIGAALRVRTEGEGLEATESSAQPSGIRHTWPVEPLQTVEPGPSRRDAPRAPTTGARHDATPSDVSLAVSSQRRAVRAPCSAGIARRLTRMYRPHNKPAARARRNRS